MTWARKLFTGYGESYLGMRSIPKTDILVGGYVGKIRSTEIFCDIAAAYNVSLYLKQKNTLSHLTFSEVGS